MGKVAIIGGGAAGMMAAISAAECGHETHILKKMKNWEKNYILQVREDAIFQMLLIWKKS